MESVVLVTGGCRSGKSAFAQQLAEKISGNRLFVATCPRTDAEMDLRIQRHQQARLNRGWQSVEEPYAPADVITGAAAGTTILVDCLTLWVSNLLLSAESSNQPLTEDRMALLAEELVSAAQRHHGCVLMVTNEVGLGIVPENSLARRYRDLVGRCNQYVAAGSDQVYLVSCGIPMQLKG